ncbi:MAG: CBS domain-containing protein [Myxococcaceae bacterium]|nr:CBS domain-containing protein [Myxococcaceae bacterium]
MNAMNPNPIPRRIRDLMTPSPKTVTPATTVGDAYLLMTEGNFRHLPVVADGRVVGMLSDRDIFRHMPPPAAQNTPDHGRFVNQPVGTLMSRPVLSVSPDEPIETAADVMLTEHVSALAVTGADGRLVGVVTLSDLARFAGWLIRSLPLP